MKWMFAGLLIAALLIGAGFLLTEGSDETVSSSGDALELCKLGSDQVQAYKFSEGAKNLESALELDPTLAEAAISLSFAYGRLGYPDKYKKTLAMADSLVALIADDNRRMVAQMRLGLRHKESKNTAIFDSLLVRLETEQPDNIHVMVAAAENVSRLGQPELEYAAWNNILEKNPNFAESYNRLGYLELGRGNFDQAIELMTKYAFLAPNLANPHDSLGDVYMVMGRYEDAAQEFRESVALQPDFHISYINLGKTYLYRGMIQSGVDIMNKVHEMVEGTKLARKVDQDLLSTYLALDMEAEIDQMTHSFVTRYPDDDSSAFYRAIRYAYLDRMEDSQAVMDSSLAHWRGQEVYHAMPSFRDYIDLAQKQYDAIIADIADSPSTRIRKWSNILVSLEPKAAEYKLWSLRLKLASAYLDNGEVLKAKEQLAPILTANNRLVPALVLAVKTDIGLKDATGARMALEQLKWSVQNSDEDYVGRINAAELEDLVIELEGNS